MKNLHFTTIFDSNYLSRAVTLYHSLMAQYTDFSLYVVALDTGVIDFFIKNPFANISVIPIEEIETYYPELSDIKKERTPVNYIFTLSPYYPLYILQKYPAIPHICSLDVDQYFFSSPLSVFDALHDASVLLTPHRFPHKLKQFGCDDFGIYNVSFQIFKHDDIGVACLELWRKQCFDWCRDVVEQGKFADQKYLESWSGYFGNRIQEITNIGVGLAPWNIDNYSISSKKKQVYVDSAKLILYHYQGLRLLEHGFIYTAFEMYGATMKRVIMTHILKPIIRSLYAHQQNNHDTIPRYRPSFCLETVQKESIPSYFRYMHGRLYKLKTYLLLRLLLKPCIYVYRFRF